LIVVSILKVHTDSIVTGYGFAQGAMVQGSNKNKQDSDKSKVAAHLLRFVCFFVVCFVSKQENVSWLDLTF